MLDPKTVRKFKKEIFSVYRKNKRDHLPWRKTHNPYHILVSEIMLQQTQVERVIPKYKAFIKRFGTVKKLADASQSEVLSLWQGLGYNRRALFLKKCAEEIVSSYKGIFPKDYHTLLTLKGIGQSTAGAVLNFAYNIPTPFIETNIRAIYLHYFFKDSSNISDIQILSLVQETIDTKNPREWFYALYDYGTLLKAQLGKRKSDLHKKSKGYVKQSKFDGSDRQIRGQIVKVLLELKSAHIRELQAKSTILQNTKTEKIYSILQRLSEEGFIEIKKKGTEFAIL